MFSALHAKQPHHHCAIVSLQHYS